MEISKGLQEEILAVQNKLKNAIRDHQICVGKLKDDPNNTDILGQIQEIHLHIVSLGRCQKQVVQRLRKEVEAFKAQNVNGAKVSIASLLGLNNNNHITNNNEEKHERKIAPVVVNAKPSKEDYEEIVRNGDVPSPPQDVRRPKQRSVSVETISGEDDVIEVSMDENSNEKQEDLERQRKTEDDEKVNFLSGLGLITTVRYAELQNKRAERKRRSTANPQFVYSSLEMPTKRKRHSYLQSTGCAPQTRQTTARLNGPSPPPSKVSPPKAVSPPTRTVTKSLIPVQKSTTRPNILRNVTDSKVYVSKAKTESEACQVQLPTPSVKPIVTQSANSKTVHIPGLPSSLTIERIESDSVVCINCRNPGTLTVCENCSASYHVSCHSISPPPPRTCPKCALVNEEEEGRLRFRKDEELATATHATGIIRKTGEDAEIHKATRGLYKADATQKRHSISSALGISQLPSSTFLIPISPNGVPTTSVGQTDTTVTSCTIDHEQSENSVPYSSIVFNQLPRSSITYVNSEPSQVSYAYQLPANNAQPEKHQSYLIVQKITEAIGRGGSQHSGNQTERSILPAVLNYQLPTTSGNNARVQSEVSVSNSALLFDKHVPSRNRKKPKRAVPPLNRIVNPEKLCIPAECKLEQSTVNGRKPGRIKQPRAKLGINQLRTARATEILLPAYDITESDEQLQIAKSAAGAEEATILGNRSKYRSRTGGILHSLFTGHNKSYIITDHSGESRGTNASAVDNDSDPYQQLHHQDQQLESAGAQSNDPAGQTQRGALTKFFGHVKLEEAHLSAPPRAKLIRKSVTASEDNENCTNENSRGSGRSGTPGAGELGPSDDTDDELPEHDSRQRSWLAGLLTTKDDAKGSSKKTLENRYERILGSHQKPDIMTYERKRSSGANSINATSAQRRSKEHGGMETTGGRKQSTRVALLRRSGCREIAPKPAEGLERAQLGAQSNSLQLRNEVSVPDDKADTERQDLSSGRRSAGSGSSSRGSNRSSRSSIDSVTPEQATDETAEHSRRGRPATDFEEHLGINSVSPENMQVLEQFESAMLEADRGNAATC